MADAPTKPPLQMSDLTGFTELDEFGVMPREEKLERSLENPKLPGAMKMGAIKEITRARIRHQLAALLSQEMPNLQAALAEVRADNPKVYIDQLLNTLEFVQPRQKAVEVEHSSEEGRRARDLSMDDLMRALTEPEPDADVVSVQ